MTATLHCQNADLFYQLGGKADAPAIVLLHGGLGSAEDFARCCPACKRISAPSLSTRADTDAPRAATCR
nr:hypothetical protein [uncultured Kingella sp.]